MSSSLTRRAVRTAPAWRPGTLTLGYGVIQWIEQWLIQPDGGTAGEPFRLTPEQCAFIHAWYAVDARGRWVFRRGVLRRAKGWGKSPFLGALALAELLGPVRFSHFDALGNPVGKAHPAPWVIIAGISLEQTANTMRAIMAMISDDLREEYGVDDGVTRINTPTGTLRPITANAASKEGARPTFAVLDEPHQWMASNGGHALARVIRRNLAKVGGRAVETTNAHAPGQDSVAQRSYEAWRKQRQALREGRIDALDILYDSREAPAATSLADREDLLEGLRAAYGDAAWVDLDALVAEIWDPDTDPAEARRFYLNQITATSDSWVDPRVWDANEDKDLRPLEPGDEITLGFDGGRTDDASALVAMRVSDGTPWLLGIWQRPDTLARGERWEVDATAVRAAVDSAFATYKVLAFFSDVALWETDVDRWSQLYRERLQVKASRSHAVAFDMRGHSAEIALGAETLRRASVSGELRPNGDVTVAAHVHTARRRVGRYGVTFAKETPESPLKVDILAAMLLADIARRRVLGDTTKRKRPGRAYGF